MGELNSRGSSQASGDRNAENQILNDGGTSNRSVHFRKTAKKSKSQASVGLKYQDEFNVNHASCLLWLGPEFFWLDSGTKVLAKEPEVEAS